VTNSFPREVCEHALAHSLPGRVEAAYGAATLVRAGLLRESFPPLLRELHLTALLRKNWSDN